MTNQLHVAGAFFKFRWGSRFRRLTQVDWRARRKNRRSRDDHAMLPIASQAYVITWERPVLENELWASWLAVHFKHAFHGVPPR